MRLLQRQPVERQPVDEVAEQRDARERLIREARVENARRQSGWHEITPAERLVRRGPNWLGWLVDVETDRVYVIARGTFFDPHSAAIVADYVEVRFYVDSVGRVVVLEPVSSVPSWSWFVERQARR